MNVLCKSLSVTFLSVLKKSPVEHEENDIGWRDHFLTFPDTYNCFKLQHTVTPVNDDHVLRTIFQVIEFMSLP